MTTAGLSEFSARMEITCDELRLPAGRGRTAALARKFAVSPNAAKKWLSGLGYPEMSKAVEIASAASFSVLWLLQGAGPMRAAGAGAVPAAVAAATEALAAAERREVLQYLRFKLEQQPPQARERIAVYIAQLRSAEGSTYRED